MMMNDTIIYLIQSGSTLALLYSLYWFFLKKETFFKLNRLYLVVAPFLSFLIPLIKLQSPFRVNTIAVNTSGMETFHPSNQSIHMTDILLYIYLIGLGLFFMRFLIQFILLLRVLRKNSVHKYAGYRVILVDCPISPFSFFHYIFIHRATFSDSEFNRILAHELVHVRQHHSIDIIFSEIFVIIQWFNPFVWPYKRALKETHEYLADAGVIAQGCDRAEYQLLILQQFVGDKLFAFANSFHQSQIKRRLTMMMKNKSKKSARLKALLILPILSFLVLAFARPRMIDASDHNVNSQVLENQTNQQDKAKSKISQKELEKKKQYFVEVSQKLGHKIIEVKNALAETKLKEDQDKLKKQLEKLEIEKDKLNKEMTLFKVAAEKEKRANVEFVASKEKLVTEKEELKAMAEKLFLQLKKIDEKIVATESAEVKKELKMKKLEMEKKAEIYKIKMALIKEMIQKTPEKTKKSGEVEMN